MITRLHQSFKAVAIFLIMSFLLCSLAAPAHAWWSSWVRIDAQANGSACNDLQVQLWPSETASNSSAHDTLRTYRNEGVLLPVGASYEVSVWGCGGYADKTIHVYDAWDQVKQVELK